MTEREALTFALEALEEINKLSIGERAISLPAEIDTAMDAIKEVLAQPEQEPVAWQVWVGADTPLNAPMGWQFYNTYDSLRSAETSARTINSAKQAPFAKISPLYTTPPQRTWVGLTKQDAEQLVDDCDWYNDPVSFCFDVEAKLKEKNT